MTRATDSSKDNDPAPNLGWGKPPGPPPGHRSTIPPIAITPRWSSPPPVSRSLYHKAAAENDNLTSVERLYLLSLLDLPGKALAHPDSLTEEQRDMLLGRPPPKLLACNIRRFFPASEPEPRDENSNGQRVEGQTAGKRQLATVAEVVDAFQDSTRLATLSYEALECISLGWWTMHQERAPAPWQDWDLKTDDAGEAAAALLSKIRLGEAAFEEAARELWLRPETMEKMGEGAEPETEVEDLVSMVERAEQYAAEASRLREQLRTEVAKKLESLSEEDKNSLEELRERMRVEVARDAEEDARKDEIEAEERKRKAGDEAEKNRNKRARKTGGEDDEGAEDDSDEEGYVLGTLVFD